jgi:signal recognition particle receptor subunit beta
MVQINFALKEVNCKIVFYGPGMSGKTTNLEIVHEKAPAANKGELTSISTDGDRTLFFDFMPLDLGTIAGMRTKFQLYTVPGQVYYNATRKLVLQGVDGVIFVADSDPAKLDENLESYGNLLENLIEYGKDPAELPHVIQYNKRDLPNAMSVEDLDKAINKYGVPTFEASARTGEGVFPTLKTLAGMVLESIDRMDQRRRPVREPSSAAVAHPELATVPEAMVAVAHQTCATGAPQPTPTAPDRSNTPTEQLGGSDTSLRRDTGPRLPSSGQRPAAIQTPRRGRSGGRPQNPQATHTARRPSVARRPMARRRASVGPQSHHDSGMTLMVFTAVAFAVALAGVVYFVMKNPGS